jgi:hypothetical protein
MFQARQPGFLADARNGAVEAASTYPRFSIQQAVTPLIS